MKRTPLLIRLLWAVLVVHVIWLRLTDAHGDQGLRNAFSFISIASGLVVHWAWIILGGGLERRSRLTWLLAPPLCLAAFFSCVRFNGYSGYMIPDFSWRWAVSEAPREITQNQGANHTAGAESSPLDYPGFLGPGRRGRADGVDLVPDWRTHPPQLLWRQAVGKGWSGFSVQGDLAVTMEERDGTTGLYAYFLTTGELLWAHTWPGSFDHSLAGPGPRCTPSIALGRVYGHGPRGRLVCVDADTGALIWEHDLPLEYGVTQDQETKNVLYGRANSPLVTEGMLIIPGGGDAAGKQVGLAAFDALTGDVLWESPRRQQSYASPTRATLAGLDQILTVNEGSITGHDPTDGKILWEHPWPSGSSADSAASQAVPLPPDGVLISKGYGLGSLRLQLSPATGKPLEVSVLWHERRLLRTKLTNVVLRGSYAYGLSDGILECADLEQGRRVWKGGRFGHGQILGSGDLLLVQTEEGEIILREASPEAKPGTPGADLGRILALDGKAWNNLALAGDVLLVRNSREASAWRLAVQPR
jgi:outer membrane protein assembly factor BamB